MFEVTLERRCNGSAFGTCCDLIEAATVTEAAETAIAMWRDLDPRFTCHPLLTIEQRPSR